MVKQYPQEGISLAAGLMILWLVWHVLPLMCTLYFQLPRHLDNFVAELIISINMDGTRVLPWPHQKYC